MVLMGVGQHDADEIFSLLDQVADVRIDEIDAGQVLFAGDRHAEVDRQPGSAALGAEPVDAEVHADLAHPAERREDELVVRSDHAGTGNTSPAAIVVVVPSDSFSTRWPAALRSVNRPVTSSVPTATRMWRPISAA